MDDVRNALGQATEVDVTVARHQWTVWATNLDRLTAFKDGPTGTVIDGYSYDATGNRLSAQVNGSSQTYSYPTDSHRLASVAGAARSYDAAGNTTAIDGTAREFAYDATGRLSQAKRSGTLAMEYRYNDRGEQVRRFLGTINTYTLYDEAGHWLGDYDGNGKALQQAIWLDDLPVGVLAGTALNYVQPDHLGAPRTVIDPVRDVAIWKWDIKGEAFGNTPPDQDADRDGTAFVFGMRFLGQRYDSATGLNQNYFRDYDTGSGRYAQSDPIGLKGAISTYGYAQSSPIFYIDPFGLRVDLKKMVEYMNENANSKSKGQCAKYVRLGLEAGGADTSGHPIAASGYGPVLQKNDFSPVDQINENEYGDVIVFPAIPGHPYGHIEVYNGSSYVSDFSQSGFYPAHAYENSSPVTFRLNPANITYPPAFDSALEGFNK